MAGNKKILFHPALTIDRDRKKVSLGIPFSTPSFKNGKAKINERLLIVTNKGDYWTFDEEELKKRDLIPTATPAFGTTEPRWSSEYIKAFLNKAKSYESDNGDGKITGKLNPYKDVFIPIRQTLKRFIDFSNPVYSTVITFWIMGTYLFPIFEAYAYLGVGGMKNSGKSKLLELLLRLAFNTFPTSNATPSSLFRTIEKNLPTILIDEGESLTGRESNSDLRLILNAGYKASGIVTRTNTDSFNVETFRVYCPKAIASINPLDASLASRCIEIVLLRTANKTIGRTRINDRSANWQELRNSLYVFMLEYALEVAELFDNDEGLSELANRSNELFLPLFSIAALCDRFVPENETKLLPILTKFAEEASLEEDSLDDWSLWVLGALDSLVTDYRDYLIRDIRKRISEQRVAQGELIDEKMTPNWIGACLRRFGFKKGQATNQGKTYLISRKQITDLQIRFCLREPESGSGDPNSYESRVIKAVNLLNNIFKHSLYYNGVKNNPAEVLKLLAMLEPYVSELEALGIPKSVSVAVLSSQVKVSEDLVKLYLKAKEI